MATKTTATIPTIIPMMRYRVALGDFGVRETAELAGALPLPMRE